MAYKIISYKNVYNDSGRCTHTFVWADTTEEFYHVSIGEIDGRQYAKIMDDVTLATQPSEIDYQEHDLSSDADLKAQLNEISVDNQTARMHRKMDYPQIGDQLDEILKYFKELKAGGTTLPTGLDAIVTSWEAAKTNNPKDGDL